MITRHDRQKRFRDIRAKIKFCNTSNLLNTYSNINAQYIMRRTLSYMRSCHTLDINWSLPPRFLVCRLVISPILSTRQTSQSDSWIHSVSFISNNLILARLFFHKFSPTFHIWLALTLSMIWCNAPLTYITKTDFPHKLGNKGAFITLCPAHLLRV